MIELAIKLMICSKEVVRSCVSGGFVRVLIVDDSQVMREILGKLVQDELKMTVAGFAEDGNEAVVKYCTLMPELVLMDIMMPHKDGISALTEILAFDPFARVIMISSNNDAATVLRCMKAGAKTFISKPNSQNTSLAIDELRREVTLALEID